MKFKIKYYRIEEIEEEIEEDSIVESQIVNNFRERHGDFVAIKEIKYIPPEGAELKEFYCLWLDMFENWKSKVVKAHDEIEIKFNLPEAKNFDFYCCLNNPKAKESLYRSIWD